MAFAGIGALLTAAFIRGINVDIGWGDTRVLKAGIEPLRFGPSVCFAVLITAGLAVADRRGRPAGARPLPGRGDVRLRAGGQPVPLRPADPERRLHATRCRCAARTSSASTSRRSATFYFVTLGGAGGDGGRRRPAAGERRRPATIAVRDNPDTAAAYTVSNTRTKLQAFALAGGLAALGGALLAGATSSRVPSDRYFTVADSLLVVSIVVIGGLGSVAGTVLGAMWVIGLPAVLPGQRPGPAAHLERRPARAPALLPGRSRSRSATARAG